MPHRFPARRLALSLMGCALLWTAPGHAANAGALPGPADLQRLQDVLRKTPAAALPMVVVPTLPEPPSPTASELREDTRLYVKAIDLRGVTQLSPAAIAPLFENITGQDTSLAALDRAVAGITAAYRDNGFFLSRALLPEQDISGGVVIIQAIEGRLDDVALEAPARVQSNPLVQKLIARLKSLPPTSRNFETILLQLNDLPGLAASGSLSPGKAPGTTTLTVAIAETRGDASFGISNHGTRYLGPLQAEAQGAANNILSPGGDRLEVQALQTPNWSDLSLVAATYSLPLNSHGTTLSLGGFTGVSRPKWVLEDLDISSRTNGLSLTLDQNLVRRRALTWNAYGTFDWNDADSTSLGNQLSADHLRVARVGTSLTQADPIGALLSSRLEVSKGLDTLGATQSGFGASRLRGHADFTKVKLDLSRLQRLNETWNLLLASSAQFSDHALLAGEEFGLGGEGFGRGYDTNELVGEQGVANRVELQANFAPDFPWLQSWQLFGFYDVGSVWNKDRDPTEPNTAQTLASIGYGARLQFSNDLFGELMFAKPINRAVASNGDTNPTIYFRLKSKFSFSGRTAADDLKPASPKGGQPS